MKRTQPIEECRARRLERIWMTSLVVCAAVYVGCMMVELGPKRVGASIDKPIQVMGLVAGTALFAVGILGAFVFARPEA